MQVYLPFSMLNLVLKEVKNGSIDWICLESTIIVQRKFDINKTAKRKAKQLCVILNIYLLVQKLLKKETRFISKSTFVGLKRALFSLK